MMINHRRIAVLLLAVLMTAALWVPALASADPDEVLPVLREGRIAKEALD